jgi:hypothetical protein
MLCRLVPRAMSIVLNPNDVARERIPAAAGILLALAPAPGPTRGNTLFTTLDNLNGSFGIALLTTLVQHREMLSVVVVVQ